jgi:uncharacterized DUF497 family protein
LWLEIGVDFEWDPVKDRTNEARHGISFDDTNAVFLDAQRLIEDATRPEHGERRARRDERERYRQSAETA